VYDQTLPKQRICGLFSRPILKSHQAEDILIRSDLASGINIILWNNKIWNETVHDQRIEYNGFTSEPLREVFISIFFKGGATTPPQKKSKKKRKKKEKLIH